MPAESHVQNNRIWKIEVTLYPLVLLIAASTIFQMTNLDLLISNLFYRDADHFYLKNLQLCAFFYHRGGIPGITIGLIGLIILIAGRFRKAWQKHTRIGLFLLLMLIIGPGIVVNSVFENHWGRPRPREVKMYDGTQVYLPLWQKGEAGNGKSFPSGHAAIGYYLMAPFFLFYSKGKKRHAYFFLGLGLVYGSIMGVCRIAEGAHFASDVMWSAGFVYYTGLFLAMGLHLGSGADVVKTDIAGSPEADMVKAIGMPVAVSRNQGHQKGKQSTGTPGLAALPR